MIAAVVDHFYGRMRSDPTLGPVFNGAIADWHDHLSKLASFWSSVMLRSGRYKGNPVATHLRHKDSITQVMFDRWLALWSEVTLEQLPEPAARAMQARAAMIAESLKLSLFFCLPSGATATAEI
jgi:hemoglobin